MTELPHNRILEQRETSAILQEFLSDRGSQEAYFAVSLDFWNPDDRASYDGIYAEYKTHFTKVLADIVSSLGKPTWQGSWADDECPGWAVGDQVALWHNQGDPFCLALYHEDKEVPILIRLGRP